MPEQIRESLTLKEAATPTGKAGRKKLVLITPGAGSSGYYSQEVLKEAAKNKVFPKGTQSHLNHDTEMERIERPTGNLRNLAAVTTEDAYWDGEALVAESRIGTEYRQMIEDFGEYIGVSINASAEVSMGEVDGKPARVIEALLPGPTNRVDFVTVAGRGGRIEEVLESARQVEEARNVGAWMEARLHSGFTALADDAYGDGRLTREERITLSGALGEALAAFTSRVEADAPQLFERDIWEEPAPAQSAEESADKDSPSSTAGVTEKKEAATMATTTIEESEYATLKENASRATTLETELKEAKAREAALVKSNNDATAARIVAEAFDGIKAPKTINRLSESYKLNEEGAVDEAALKAEAEESAAEWKVANGEGSVRGVGQSSVVEESKEVADGDILTALKGGK